MLVSYFSLSWDSVSSVAYFKGLVKLIVWMKVAFICYVKTVPVDDLKLVLVVLHPSVKEFFKISH